MSEAKSQQPEQNTLSFTFPTGYRDNDGNDSNDIVAPLIESKTDIVTPLLPTLLLSSSPSPSQSSLSPLLLSKERARLNLRFKPLKDTPLTRHRLNLSPTALFPTVEQQTEALIKERSIWTSEVIAIATKARHGSPRVISKTKSI